MPFYPVLADARRTRRTCAAGALLLDPLLTGRVSLRSLFGFSQTDARPRSRFPPPPDRAIRFGRQKSYHTLFRRPTRGEQKKSAADADGVRETDEARERSAEGEGSGASSWGQAALLVPPWRGTSK